MFNFFKSYKKNQKKENQMSITEITETTPATPATPVTPIEQITEPTLEDIKINIECDKVIFGTPEWFLTVKDKFTLSHSDDLSIFYVKLNGEIVVAIDRDEDHNKFNMESTLGREVTWEYYRWDFNKKNGGKRINTTILSLIYDELQAILCSNIAIQDISYNVEVTMTVKKPS